MLVVIPMAGESRRFRDAGYNGHKALLPMPDGRALIEWIIESLRPSELITIEMLDDVEQIGVAVEHSREIIGFEWNRIWLKERPNGPLDTILKARHLLERDCQVSFSYCDCFTTEIFWGYIPQNIRSCMAGIQSEDERFTKIPESELRAAGVFWFRNAGEFLELASGIESNDSHGVPSVVYKTKKFFVSDFTGCYEDLGTPESYENFIGRFRK